MEAASRNISACNAQAISHVGCRLIVASSAKTTRPFAPAAWGDIACTSATNAAISSEAYGLASGKKPDLPAALFCAEDTSPADFGFVGSADISAHKLCKPYVRRDRETVNARERRQSLSRPSTNPA